MFEAVTLVLVLYVLHSICWRAAERRREVERLKSKISELQKVVSHLRNQDDSDGLSELMVELELRDIQTRLSDFRVPVTVASSGDFEHAHFVEGPISKSIVIGSSLPTEAESTL